MDSTACELLQTALATQCTVVGLPAFPVRGALRLLKHIFDLIKTARSRFPALTLETLVSTAPRAALPFPHPNPCSGSCPRLRTRATMHA
jgi:hypothetical protein